MSQPRPLASRSPAQRASLRRRLDGLHRTFDRRYLATDPLMFVHRYEADADREIVAFLAASLAFGNVRAIQASLAALLAALGPSPARFVDRFDPARDGAGLARLYHRWIRGRDLILLLATLRRMRSSDGSVGGFFMRGYRPEEPDIGQALASFSERAHALSTAPRSDAAGAQGHPAASRKGPGGRAGRRDRGAGSHGSIASFFPSPRDGSACKRLNLFLRWMVRDGDGLDLGLWKGISRRQLVLPLDTHLARLSRALGLTARRSPGWKMALEATRSLALLDPEDPVKYDFALSRLGILALCLHGKDPLDCRTCPPPRPRVRRANARARVAER